MRINLRGGLGNQIIQLAFAMNSGLNPRVNTSAVNLREQLLGLPGVEYEDSRFWEIVGGVLRKIKNVTLRNREDLIFGGLHDGYFQYGDLTNLLSDRLLDVLRGLLSGTRNEHIVFHVRGGDYLTRKASRVYSKVRAEYYVNSINALMRLDAFGDRSDILILTNDERAATAVADKINGYRNLRVNLRAGSGEWEDFSTLANAKIAVIPNSTFSFVARLLYKDNAITVCPRNWFTIKSGLVSPSVDNFIYIANEVSESSKDL